jgi:hypothetical protein
MGDTKTTCVFCRGVGNILILRENDDRKGMTALEYPCPKCNRKRVSLDECKVVAQLVRSGHEGTNDDRKG